MPATARRLGVADSFDARQNIFAGTQYLRILLDQFGGDVDLALAAYNAGAERRPPLRRHPARTARPAATCRRCRPSSARLRRPRASPPARPPSTCPPTTLRPPAPPAARPRRLAASVEPARPRTYYRWRDERGRHPRRRGAPARGDGVLRPCAPSTSHARPHPARPVRPGPLPRPLQQGARALRGPPVRRGGAAARGGLPPPAPGPAGAEPARPRLLPRREARQGRGGLPQAHRGEPRRPHPALQPGAHLLQAGPAGGRRVRLPARPSSSRRATRRSTSTWARSTSGCSATRTRSTSTGRPGANLMVQRLQGRIGRAPARRHDRAPGRSSPSPAAADGRREAAPTRSRRARAGRLLPDPDARRRRRPSPCARSAPP